ncbi:hypothetical protein ECA3413 [Pectobacterium atrosepticum SCRI1043]|uniref:Uncharacterized protein n=1 Tax=Pectobacterium atrosepticum (strain SCRI 1043 / ATCC BAA-672) TaxID=218491 RepID=Q6D1N2_PECAS|nr:hypothetical protein ECA3413 [Pectobacterium atrosepticum SCRI1043]
MQIQLIPRGQHGLADYVHMLEVGCHRVTLSDHRDDPDTVVLFSALNLLKWLAFKTALSAYLTPP